MAALLANGPRRLLILDDAWTEEQLAVFPVAGRCARLVTTRNPSLVPGAGARINVDQMSGSQARALLLAGLPPAVAGLLERTGRSPLLLRLVNKILIDQVKLDPHAVAAAEDLLGLLVLRGPVGVRGQGDLPGS